MSCIMNLEDVEVAVRKHVQGITAIRPMLDLPRVILPTEARNTSLASLIESLAISASVDSIPQV